MVGKKNTTEFASQAFIYEIKFRTNSGLTLPCFEQPSPEPYRVAEKQCTFYFHHYHYPGTVNSLYTGPSRDLELVSSLARVRNSGSSFQSNVCKIFLPRI